MARRSLLRGRRRPRSRARPPLRRGRRRGGRPLSALDEQIQADATPDAFLALLLGLHARLQRGKERLLAAAPDGAEARESAPPRDDTVVLAALGWIAVRRNVETWLARCVADAELADTAPAAPRAPHGAGLLR